VSTLDGEAKLRTVTVGLLERERELETLATVIEAAAEGTAGFVLVEGPAGIGKSRLLAEARKLAQERELCVRSARGSELEREFPFGVVRQLFESHLVDEAERVRLLSGAASAAAPVFGHESEQICPRPARTGRGAPRVPALAYRRPPA
jgi:AAA ATPase domain